MSEPHLLSVGAMVMRRTLGLGLLGLLGCSGTPVEAESITGIGGTAEGTSSTGAEAESDATDTTAATGAGPTSASTTMATQTSGTDDTSDTTDTGGSRVCGEGRLPPGGVCPPVCTGGCDTAGRPTCVIDCDAGGDVCNNQAVECPPDFDCSVQCGGDKVCEKMELACPAEYACAVACTGVDPCTEAVINCGAGACNLSCDGSDKACEKVRFVCGTNDGVVDCSEPQVELVLDARSAAGCECSANGCE